MMAQTFDVCLGAHEGQGVIVADEDIGHGRLFELQRYLSAMGLVRVGDKTGVSP